MRVSLEGTFQLNTVKISEPPKAIATLSRGVVKVSGSHEMGCKSRACVRSSH